MQLTEEEKKRRRQRSRAIAIGLAALGILFYLITIAKLGVNMSGPKP